MSKYHPQSKPSAYPPLAPSVTAKATGGSPAVPAPSRRELFCARYRSMVQNRAFSDFQSTAWERSTPKSDKLKRVQRLKPRTRAKAKGQSRLVPPGGFSRGEQFERERVVPPLSRLLCFLSCRGKKGRPRWQALAESHLEKKLKGYDRVTMTTSKYRPIMKPELHPPLAPSVTFGDSSLPEGAMGLVLSHIGLLLL